jgi:hypothetical protein
MGRSLKRLLSRIGEFHPGAVAAAHALLADPASVDVLVKHLRDGGPDAAVAAELLWHHARRPDLATWLPLFGDDHEVDEAVLHAVAGLDVLAAADGVVAGVEARDSSMIELAGIARISAAEPALRTCVDELLGTLRSRGSTLRLGPDAIDMELEALPCAIVALAYLGSSEFLRYLPALAQLPSDDRQYTEPVRALAARGLCAHATPGMRTALEHALKGERETEVAVAIIDALTLLGTPPIVDRMLRRAGCSVGVADDRLNARLNDLIGGEVTDDLDELRKRWTKARSGLPPHRGVRGGRLVEVSTIAIGMDVTERAPTLAADAVAMTGDRLGTLRPETAARFLDLGPRVRAWAASHPFAPGTILKHGAAIDAAALD